MKANRCFEVIVTKGHLGPSFLAEQSVRDTVELLSLQDGETVAFWELPPTEAAKLLRTLRADLVTLEEHAFLERWT